MGTRCTCGDGCRTFGECVRRKRIRIAWTASSKGLDASAEKAKDRELAAYKSARDQGIQPTGTRMAQTQFALDASDKSGRPFDAGSV